MHHQIRFVLSFETWFLILFSLLTLAGGIQFATAQLPLLELMDCGMAICDPNALDSTSEESSGCELQKTSSAKVQLIYQNLIIKHSRLKKLSLWGCSGLNVRFYNLTSKFIYAYILLLGILSFWNPNAGSVSQLSRTQ